MSNKVEPRTLSGFMELLPKTQVKFNEMKRIIQESYEKFGFLPLDTPVLELSSVLLAKAGGETEKQIYRFSRGDDDISLRFDLTVPLAKYVAKNYGELTFPFRRYQIGKVYRGERNQKGRYKEFYQCDIDIIGEDELSLLNDAELPAVIYTTFKNLGFESFTICINNRKILNGLYAALDLKDKSQDIMRIIDKIDKIGADNVKKELLEIDIPEKSVDSILDFITIKGSQDEVIAKLKALNLENDMFNEGVYELEQVVNGIRTFNVPDEYFKIDLCIARGLDYYTGTVYETFLNNYRELGSVCSGGRYDNLADYYTDKKLPGVGISIGLTRLFYQLDSLNILSIKKENIAEVLVTCMEQENIKEAISIANTLRENNINTEIEMTDKKIKTKMKYANKIAVPYVIIIGEDEIKTKNYTLKNMETGEQTACSIDKIVEIVKNNK